MGTRQLSLIVAMVLAGGELGVAPEREDDEAGRLRVVGVLDVGASDLAPHDDLRDVRDVFDGEVGDALGHHGPREQAVEAAVASIYTRAMARQVAALAEAAK